MLDEPYNYTLTMGIRYLPKKNYFFLDFYFKNNDKIQFFPIKYLYNSKENSILECMKKNL